MFPRVGLGGLSLMKVLTGISKTLGIAKQFMPLYKDISPIAKKIPVFFEKLESIGRPYEKNVQENYEKDQSFSPQKENQNGPIFFQ